MHSLKGSTSSSPTQSRRLSQSLLPTQPQENPTSNPTNQEPLQSGVYVPTTATATATATTTTTTAAPSSLFHSAPTDQPQLEAQDQLTNVLTTFLLTNQTQKITTENIIATFNFFIAHPNAAIARQLLTSGVNMKLYSALQNEPNLKTNIQNISKSESDILQFITNGLLTKTKEQLHKIADQVTKKLESNLDTRIINGANDQRRYLDGRSYSILKEFYTNLFDPVTPNNPHPSTSRIIGTTSNTKTSLPPILKNSTGLVVSGDSNGSIACDTVTLLSSGQIMLTQEAATAVAMCLELEARVTIPNKKIYDLNQQLKPIIAEIRGLEDTARTLDEEENTKNPKRTNKQLFFNQCQGKPPHTILTQAKNRLTGEIRRETNARYTDLKDTPAYQKSLGIIIAGIKVNPFRKYYPAVVLLGDRYFEKLGNASCTAKFDQKLKELGLVNTEAQIQAGTVQILRGNKDFKHTPEELFPAYKIPHLNPLTDAVTLEHLGEHQCAILDKNTNGTLYYKVANNGAEELRSIEIPTKLLTNEGELTRWLNDMVESNSDVAAALNQYRGYTDVYQPNNVQEEMETIITTVRENTIMAAYDETNKLLFNHQGLLGTRDDNGQEPRSGVTGSRIVFTHKTVDMREQNEESAVTYIATELNFEQDSLLNRDRHQTQTDHSWAGVNSTLPHNLIAPLTHNLPQNMQNMHIFYGHHNTTNGLNPTSYNAEKNISAYGLNPSVYDSTTDDFYPHMLTAYLPGDKSIIPK